MPSQQDDVPGVEEGEPRVTLLKPLSGIVSFTNAKNINNDVEDSPMMGEVSPRALETAEEKKARRRSHYIVYFTTFIGSVGFSVVLTGMWPYLTQLDQGVTKIFLGLVIAANPMGQMITSPILGFWANKAGSSRGPLLAAVFIFIVGNALYSVLNVFGTAKKALMMFARFLVGVSFANMAVIRAYVAASTTTEERTTAVALTSAAQGMGFIFGPALQAAIAVAFGKEKEAAANVTLAETLEYQLEDEDNHLQWNLYTAAGWAAVVLGIVNFFLFLPCSFKEYPIAAKEAQLLKRTANADNDKFPKPDYTTVVSILVCFFIVQFGFMLIEMMLVPMCMDMYAWSDDFTVTVISVSLCLAGVLATIMFASVGALSRRFDERKIYIGLGLVPLLLAMVCFIPMGSTLPKMQNCTSETKLDDRNTRSIRTLSLYNSEATQRQLYPIDYLERYGESAIIDEPLTNHKSDFQQEVRNSLYPDSENLLAETLLYTNETNSNHKTLSRRRRRIRRERKCRDFGCPPEQEWCKYTPIIEQSQMIIASTVAFIGYPIAFSLSSSIFSKVLGPNPQGLWMGILTSTGSLSRMTGPVFVSYVYTTLGTRWIFGLISSAMAFTVILSLIFFKRLVPMKLTNT